MKSPVGLTPGVSSTTFTWLTFAHDHRSDAAHRSTVRNRGRDSRQAGRASLLGTPGACPATAGQSSPLDGEGAALPVHQERDGSRHPLCAPPRWCFDPLCDVDDGRLEIDNSAAERSLRAVVLGRKNYLFLGSDSGGQRAAALYSLIGTAKLNGLDPVLYLRTVLAKLPEHPINQIPAAAALESSPLTSERSFESRLKYTEQVSTKNKWTLKTHYPYLLKWGISYAYPEGPLDGLEVFGDGEGELLFRAPFRLFDLEQSYALKAVQRSIENCCFCALRVFQTKFS